MNIQQSPLWSTQTTESRLTGTWRSAIPDYRAMPSPCLGACPVNGRIAEWVGAVGKQDYRGAWLTLVDNNPFPAIAGRICHHPCQTACNRQYHDETVSICALERFVGDMALAEGWKFDAPAISRSESIAVVGGGPAGLSAAYQLRRRGFRVTLFEMRERLGGLLRYGIPDYRLDKKIVDGEIQRIIELGVEIKLNANVADAPALKKLRDEFDAVYLATGATSSKTLPTLDYGQPWVMDSANFLAAINAGEPCNLGARIVVVGGGSAAIDAARTARRLGRSVTVLSLEPANLLPAQPVEVCEAREEGVEFVSGAMMEWVEASAPGLKLKCTQVDFQAGTRHGEFSVTRIAGSAFTLEADAIVPSIGQNADISRWNGLLANDGGIVQTDGGWRTSVTGIFAGGDVASMDRFVTEAVGMGKQAAAAIAQFVTSQQAGSDFSIGPTVPFSEINAHYFPKVARRRPGTAAVAERLQGFGEVQQGLGHDEAIAEAQRCFSCGTCIFCDNCFFYCPDMAITKLEHGYEVKSDYCKGCGLCVEECPTGSVTMQEDTQG
ncbi:MAG: FAD-dependent oxidoreductase [Pseudolabrys sp.]|nr:FAD-dependent oxidoreductase [Pseudolabrys sp.]